MGFVIYAVQLFGERLKLCLLFWFKKEKKRNEERTKLHKRLKATQSKHWPLMKTIFLRIKPQILNPMGKNNPQKANPRWIDLYYFLRLLPMEKYATGLFVKGTPLNVFRYCLSYSTFPLSKSSNEKKNYLKDMPYRSVIFKLYP